MIIPLPIRTSIGFRADIARVFGVACLVTAQLAGTGAIDLRAQSAAVPDTSLRLRIGIVIPLDSASTRATAMLRGARLGIEEAQRAGVLFNATFSLHESTDIETLISRFHASVILLGSQKCPTSTTARAVLIVVGCVETGTQASVFRCDSVFHVSPGEPLMRGLVSTSADAARRAGVTGGVASAGSATAFPSWLRVVTWHHTLERYGAAQLNDRFRHRFADDMNGDAWAAWFAVKMVAEAALRTSSSSPERLTEHMLKPATRVDGHKGEALKFDPDTRILRQPLYLVDERIGTTTPRITQVETADVVRSMPSCAN